jgi:hypothetical protein
MPFGLGGERGWAFGREPAGLGRPIGKLGIASIVYPDRLENAEMTEGKRFSRALLVETVATVAAVVLSIGECEGGSTPHTDVGVDPFRGLGGISIFAIHLSSTY